MKKSWFLPLFFLFTLCFTSVYSQNVVPVAQNIFSATKKNSAVNIPLVATDANNDSLSYIVVANPSSGTVTITGSTVIYTPATNIKGIFTFTYKVNDGSGDSNTATVTVDIYDSFRSSALQIGADIDGEAAGDQSGYSVSYSADGTKVAIGAFNNDGGPGSNPGHVRIYNYTPSGTASWTQLGADINGEASGDNSGWSVSLSADGTKVAIGAYANGSAAGHVRIYNYTPSGTASWTQLGADIDGEALYDSSGIGVSLSADGTKVAIGAFYNDGTASNAGHVRVYSLVTFSPTVTLTDNDADNLIKNTDVVSITATFNQSIGTTTPTITIKENDYPITIRFGSGGSALSFLVQHGGMEPLTRNTAGLVSYTFKSVSSGVTYTLNSLVYTGQSWVRFNISPNFNEGSGNKDVIFIGR